MPQPSLHLLGFLFSIILSRGKCCCGRSLRTPLWLALPPAFCLKRPGPLTPPCCPGTCSSFPATSNPAPQGSPGGDVFSPASPGTCFPRLCRQTPEVQGSGFLGVRSARLTGPTQATLAILSWGVRAEFPRLAPQCPLLPCPHPGPPGTRGALGYIPTDVCFSCSQKHQPLFLPRLHRRWDSVAPWERVPGTADAEPSRDVWPLSWKRDSHSASDSHGSP